MLTSHQGQLHGEHSLVARLSPYDGHFICLALWEASHTQYLSGSLFCANVVFGVELSREYGYTLSSLIFWSVLGTGPRTFVHARLMF